MVALKAAAAERFVEKPDPKCRLMLVYGPDTGLVSERAHQIAGALATGLGGEVEPFDPDSSSEPGLLFDAATSLSLFGGQQVILVRATSKQIAGIVAAIVEHDGAAPLVVEAGDLKPSAPLRKLAEGHAAAVTIPCYTDSAEAIGRLVDTTCSKAGLHIEADARDALVSLLGGDRLATRGELEKLRNYCAGESNVTLDDVMAVCGDASALLLDDAIDAVALGNAHDAETTLRRAVESGTAIPAIIAALSRHFLQLRAARLLVEEGNTAESAMRAMRPPVFFKRQTAFKRQLSAWRHDAIDEALERIQTADAATRLNADLNTELAGRLVLSLAGMARRR